MKYSLVRLLAKNEVVVNRFVNYTKYTAFKLNRGHFESIINDDLRSELDQEYRVNKRLAINGIVKLNLTEENTWLSLKNVLSKGSSFFSWMKSNLPKQTSKIQNTLLTNTIKFKLLECLYTTDLLEYCWTNGEGNKFINSFIYGDLINNTVDSKTEPNSYLSFFMREFDLQEKGSGKAFEIESIVKYDIAIQRIAIEVVIDYIATVVINEINIMNVVHLKLIANTYKRMKLALKSYGFSDEEVILKQVIHRGVNGSFKGHIKTIKDHFQENFSQSLDLFLILVDTFLLFQTEMSPDADTESFQRLFIGSIANDQAFLQNDHRSKNYILDALKTKLTLREHDQSLE